MYCEYVKQYKKKKEKALRKSICLNVEELNEMNFDRSQEIQDSDGGDNRKTPVLICWNTRPVNSYNWTLSNSSEVTSGPRISHAVVVSTVQK